jgi:hypothetical protein
LQISLAIAQSLKGVAFQITPLNDHLHGRSWKSPAVSPLSGIGYLSPTEILSFNVRTESGSNCSGIVTIYWWTVVIYLEDYPRDLARKSQEFPHLSSSESLPGIFSSLRSSCSITFCWVKSYNCNSREGSLKFSLESAEKWCSVSSNPG